MELGEKFLQARVATSGKKMPEKREGSTEWLVMPNDIIQFSMQVGKRRIYFYIEMPNHGFGVWNNVDGDEPHILVMTGYESNKKGKFSNELIYDGTFLDFFKWLRTRASKDYEKEMENLEYQ